MTVMVRRPSRRALQLVEFFQCPSLSSGPGPIRTFKLARHCRQWPPPGLAVPGTSGRGSHRVSESVASHFGVTFQLFQPGPPSRQGHWQGTRGRRDGQNDDLIIYLTNAWLIFIESCSW